jgi:hypothetical protein
MNVELVVPPNTSKPKSKMFPVLVFLLMACYGIMAMVLVEQGNVIQSQRNLIAQLFQDSQELTALKSQEITQRMVEKHRAEEANSGQPAAKNAPKVDPKTAPNAVGKACRSCGVQMQKQQNQKNMVEKQPLQAVDKADRRRYPATI